MTPKKQVLVVEDNYLNREMLTEILQESYTVFQAENGKEALDVLKQHKDDIALILLDVMMPVMDGYSFLDIIKNDSELSLIPVIVTTQSGSEAVEIDALAHGANDFIPKPYSPRVILHRVSNIIKLRENAATINQFKYDRLTGLYSKEYFYQTLHTKLLENPDKEYTIVSSNIENFKLYNDIFGPTEGDRLLRNIASMMRNCVGDKGFCGRYGADRFLCCITRDAEAKDREAFFSSHLSQQPPGLNNTVIKWGIYEITDRTVPVEQMCDRALLAADSIKGHYNEFFAIYNDTLREKLLHEKAITDAMETAIAENQFAVYFQPKYSLSNNRMIGAEALVRWIHPTWGFMSPGEFIPIFERNGFILRLDHYVWEQVCLLLRSFKEKGYGIVPVSVNVSRADVFQNNLPEFLPKLVEKYGVDPEYIHLEITETAYVKNPDQIIYTMDRLRKLGFIVEMDDFGSGYSSLNMLSRLKLDVLKLDMKFLQNEVEKPVSQSILNDIVNMAHRLHLGVVAEGVETCEQVNHLKKVGCDYAQGYYFAKPMPCEDFEELIKTESSVDLHAQPEISYRNMNINKLIAIEEDEKYLEKICEVFNEDYSVIKVTDADSAVKRITSREDGGVSAVLLSLTLSENGTEKVLKAMRLSPDFYDVPVLALIPNGDYAQLFNKELAETDDFLCKCHPMFDLRRRVERLIELSEANKRENVLQLEAYHDYLTGILNRRGFMAKIETMKADNEPVAVCLFDLDYLKKINDEQGHDAGDRLIRLFADLLQNETRTDDIICRWGGDEFMVVLKNISDEQAALDRCNEICGLFGEITKKENLSAACSGGVALFKAGEMSFDSIIERADNALYISKRRNKGACRLWEG